MTAVGYEPKFQSALRDGEFGSLSGLLDPNVRFPRWIQWVEATLYLNDRRWSDCDEKEVHTCGVHGSAE